MIKSYLLIALRKLSRERAYVLINIFSLALGLASFFVLALYLRSELTFDHHHADHPRIYRAYSHFKSVFADADDFAITPGGLGPLMVQDFPQLGEFVRFTPARYNVLRYEDKEAQWDDAYLADPNVFTVFTHEVVAGDPTHALDDPNSVALSETAARRYFGNENPIGKTLDSGGVPFSVTLVFRDLPENVHLKYDVLYSMSLQSVLNPRFVANYETGLFNVGTFFTYFRVSPEFRVASFPQLMSDFYDRRMATRGLELKTTYAAVLQPLADVHFGPRLLTDRPNGNIFYVYGFAAVAIFILVVACINYINLATARAARRAKEVGMRKVLGASHGQLIGQFLGESATFTLIALVIAVLLVPVVLSLTPLGSLMGRENLLEAALEPQVWIGVLVVGALVALMAGLYPAFYLARISPLVALTHVRRSWQSGFNVRQVLVLLQLCISIGVIAATLLMFAQMRYVNGLPLGFSKENRLVLSLRGYDAINNAQTIFDAIRRIPNVVNVSAVGQVPGMGSLVTLIETETNAGAMEQVPMARVMVGLEYIDTMNVELVSGRGFSRDIATDLLESAVVNESLVRKMGWEEPLGKRFQFGRNRTLKVIGVVKDYHYSSLHNAVGPLVIVPDNEDFSGVPVPQRPLMTSTLVVAMTGANTGQTVQAIRAVVADFDKGFQAEPYFLEDRLGELYESENNLLKLTGVFAGICILISVLGMYGLAAYTTEQRTREIGIRKVLGASDGQIVTMLSKYLLPLVVVAAVPSAILCYYAIEVWLQRFAYRTSIDWLVFLYATLVVALVAVLTVVLQGLKTTRANPMDALRVE